MAWTIRRARLAEAGELARINVAVDGDRIGAFCGVCPVRNVERDAHPERPTGEVAALYADPAVWGTGAGHAVHEAALAHLAASGFGHAELWVIEANIAALLHPT